MLESGTPAGYERLLNVLLREERLLGELLTLAREEQFAIIHADYAGIQRLSGRMEEAADAMETLATEREALVAEIDTGQTLAEIAQAAETHGMRSLTRARRRLRMQVDELRGAQETNARLVIEAMRIRERWYGMLAGGVTATYGAAGQAEMRRGRGLVSRSA